MITCVLGDTRTLVTMMRWKWWEHILVILFNDDYFGDDGDVWIICTWLSDSFCEDDFLVYTLEMIIVFILDN